MSIITDSSPWISFAYLGGFAIAFGLVILLGPRRDVSLILVAFEYCVTLLATLLLCDTWCEPTLLMLFSLGALLTSFENPLHLTYGAMLIAFYSFFLATTIATIATNYVCFLLLVGALCCRGREVYIVHILQKSEQLND
jgi:hypothetical protein